MSGTEVVVGRIGRPHGVRGDVSVELRSDEPERRFAPGAVLTTRRATAGTTVVAGHPASLTVATTRWHQSRLLVTFEEVRDRTAAEALRGLLLAVEVDPLEFPDDPEEYYDHQLVGLSVVTTEGSPVGEVAEVLHGPAQDLLSVHDPAGREVLVPFVARYVTVVDVPGGRLVVDDVAGLVSPAAGDDEGA